MISVNDFCKMKCDSIMDNYRNSPNNTLVLSNFGALSEDNVDSILLLIETKLENAGEPKGLIKRVFSVVVESLQNIRIHGTQNDDAKDSNFIVVGKERNDYKISVANVADNDVIEKIKSSLRRIKGMNPIALKKIYMNSLTLGKLSKKGGAGLGLVTIALKSENNVKYDFEKVNGELTFFNLHVKVSAN